VGRPPDLGTDLKAAAALPQAPVERRHQLGRHLLRHVLRGHHHGGSALLQIADQIRPEIQQLALALGPRALALEVGGAAQPMPEGLAGGAAVAFLGQAEAERFHAGEPIQLAQAGALEKLAGGDGGDAVETTHLREGEPVRKGRGRSHGGGGKAKVSPCSSGECRRQFVKP
jgi:hypothetical protein